MCGRRLQEEWLGEAEMDAGCTHRFMRVVKLFMLFAICGEGTGDGETGYGRWNGQPLAACARVLS